MKRLTKLGLQGSAILFSAAVLFACTNVEDPGVEYAPDMYHSVSYQPYSQVDEVAFNPGGMTMRHPARGTVPRGKEGYNLYLTTDTAEVAGVELTNPLPYTEENIKQGKVLYTRFCSPCHGEAGDGQGLVGVKFKGVPSYSAGRVATLPAGHIFHVITYGRGRMMPHGSQVDPTERWKIVMYVQLLQQGSTEIPVIAGSEAENEAAGESITDNPVTGTPNPGLDEENPDQELTQPEQQSPNN
ncbi:cbb3-type cytochrome c oxidase subunit III [Pontibacter ummariensis]|uniref:Cytochrome C oxidase, cbb3-type, subunit III n=1 Tax=Pontibacter ummariensis TaxID=1610492 RepID=A0A239KXE0_9BACT|nr:cytochrome c [Pontibacter ummariensis]PRY04953.1 cbb3-type cytochrome c oxidase subunit III [Pontibacter ummariensis]SNT22169.1 Cytochrome C oxidase, cbb3-type, subunit III [Pontibacter ummariensis]